MDSGRTMKIGVAAAAALLGLLAATLAGAPLAGALLALVGGGAAAALLMPRAQAEAVPERGEEDNGEQPLLAADILDAIEDPMLVVRGRRVVAANRAARAVLGDHIEGADVRLAIRHPAAAERLTDEAAPDRSRTELVGLGQQDRRWEMTAARLADGSRLVRLTDRSEAFASEKMRGDFVANASHELRTPLATLLGFLETLQEEDAAADAKTRSRFLAIMFEEAKRMHRLIDDLISLSRIEAERFTLPRESVDLLPLVEEVRQSCAAMIEEKESGIVVENPGGATNVLGDRAQLQQLIQNLVVNALKYGRSGAPVLVRFEEAGPEMLRMSVIDQGEGIAQEHLPRLTERFYRVDAGRSRAVGGTGLGLAIVKHIVGRHRGRLEIRSTQGEGTQVHVHLPRAVIKES